MTSVYTLDLEVEERSRLAFGSRIFFGVSFFFQGEPSAEVKAKRRRRRARMEFKRSLALDGLLVGLREDNSSVMVATSARRSHGDPGATTTGREVVLGPFSRRGNIASDLPANLPLRAIRGGR